ncbi:MAG: hypothetical protein AAF604_22835 [Acidobacteriota bacterium]
MSSSRPILLLLLALAFCLPAAVSAKSPCFPREGNCVVTTVNGQPGRAASRKEKKRWVKEFGSAPYIDDAAFTLPEAVSGPLEVEATAAGNAGDWFGQLLDVDVQVVPLQAVELETERQAVTEPTVRIGGKAAVGAADFLIDNRLPPGRYLLRVRLRGSDNWDRQTLFLTVAADAESAP